MINRWQVEVLCPTTVATSGWTWCLKVAEAVLALWALLRGIVGAFGTAFVVGITPRPTAALGARDRAHPDIRPVVADNSVIITVRAGVWALVIRVERVAGVARGWTLLLASTPLRYIERTFAVDHLAWMLLRRINSSGSGTTRGNHGLWQQLLDTDSPPR